MSAAPHIYTLTGNLLAERTFEFESWTAGKTQRAVRESFQVGGKGINVSKMLTRLGAPNTALCFAGGASGAECETWLREHDFAFFAFPSARPTRSGLVVRTPTTAETTFLGCDVVPDSEALARCIEFLDLQPDGQVLALCGSFPGWDSIEFNPLRTALDRWLRRGILVADTYGPPLRWAAERQLALVKINAQEFRTLASQASDEALPDALAQAAQKRQAKAWIVTDGARDVWFAARGSAPEKLSPPSVTEVSATGSGDVLFACVIDALFRGKRSLRDAVALALPFAAANAAHPGIAEFPSPSRSAGIGKPPNQPCDPLSQTTDPR